LGVVFVWMDWNVPLSQRWGVKGKDRMDDGSTEATLSPGVWSRASVACLEVMSFVARE